MAQVTVQVNGKPYAVGCEDGQESHVRGLALLLDAKVREIAPDAGQLGETRLMLLGALMIADEVDGLNKKLAAAEAKALELTATVDEIESRAIVALDAASQKLEAIAAR